MFARAGGMPLGVRDQILKLFGVVKADSPLWPVARAYAWTVPVVAALGFLATALEGVGISLLIPLLGTLLETESVAMPGPLAAVSAFTERFEPGARLMVVGGAILAFVVLKGAVQALNAGFIAWVDGRASHDVRNALARRLLRAPYPFFLQNDFARLLNILSTDSWRASDGVRIAFGIVAGVAAATAFSIFLLLMNWKLTLVVGAGALVIRAIQLWFVRRAEQLSRGVSESNLRLGERMLHVVQAMRLIRLFGQERREEKDFDRASAHVRSVMLRTDVLQAVSAGLLEVLYAALFIAILLGAYAAGVALPTLAAFLVLLYRFQPFLRQLAAARLQLAATRTSVEEVEWLLGAAPAPATPPDLPAPRELGDIVFDDVSYAYADGERGGAAVTGLSFTIAKGRSTALLGPSGSGKSTVINLICGLLQPDTGRILSGGAPIAGLDMEGWRGLIAFAGQDAELFDGTLADNIRYGAPSASQAEIEEAARLAQIDEFVATLPQGYETTVGTGGLGLSGGQRQRIGLARAFLRRPQLLILDEATSAVDALSEEAILKLVAACDWKPTTLIVSHRAATLKSCQDGVVLAGGRVMEAGPLARLKAWRSMAQT